MSEPHFSRERIGNLLSRRSERGTNEDPLLSVTQQEGVIPQDEAGRRNISSSNRSTYWRVYPDDIVYNTMRMWQGASARSQLFGIVSPAYTVCQPAENVSSEYLAYALKLPQHIALFRTRSQGITSDVWNLRYAEFAKFEIPFPHSLSQQRRIAEILSTVDEAIEQTEALIAKTQQIKAGLMHDLFTRGITANGELRPPREEAPELYKVSPLGWIPQEWLQNSLQQWLVFPPKNGYSASEVPEWTGHSILGLGCLTPDGFQPIQLKNVLNTEPKVLATTLQDGDLLISRSNTRELVGLVGTYAPIGHPCSYPDLMMRLRPNSEVIPRFLELCLRSPAVRRQIQAQAVGTSSSMVKISGAIVKRLQVAIPPVPEQERILALDSAAKEQIDLERKNVAQLSLSKHGLMQDLLTGRVRVKTNSSPNGKQADV